MVMIIVHDFIFVCDDDDDGYYTLSLSYALVDGYWLCVWFVSMMMMLLLLFSYCCCFEFRHYDALCWYTYKKDNSNSSSIVWLLTIFVLVTTLVFYFVLLIITIGILDTMLLLLKCFIGVGCRRRCLRRCCWFRRRWFLCLLSNTCWKKSYVKNCKVKLV